MFFWSHLRCFGPLGKFQHNIKISIKTARVSRLSVSYDYVLRQLVVFGAYSKKNLVKSVMGRAAVSTARLFWENHPLSKNSKNSLRWSQFLIVTQGYSLQPKTLSDVFMRIFWNSGIKTFKEYPEKRMEWNSRLIKINDYSLQPTTRLKSLLQILFWKFSERKKTSKIPKIWKNSCRKLNLSH